MVELVDTSDLGSDASRRGGSSPFIRTILPETDPTLLRRSTFDGRDRSSERQPPDPPDAIPQIDGCHEEAYQHREGDLDEEIPENRLDGEPDEDERAKSVDELPAAVDAHQHISPEEAIRPHELRIVPDREEQAAQQQRHDTPAQFAAAPHPVAFGTDRNRKTRGATPAQPLAAIRALGDRIVVGMIVTVHNRSFTVVCSDRHDPRTTSARLSETIVFRGRRHHAPYPAARKRIVQN